MALPSKVKPGDPIRAGDWNSLIDFVRACQVQPSANVKVTRGASGTILSLTLPPTRRVSTPDQYPFQVVVVPPQNPGDDPQLGVISDSHVQKGGVLLDIYADRFAERSDKTGQLIWDSVPHDFVIRGMLDVQTGQPLVKIVTRESSVDELARFEHPRMPVLEPSLFGDMPPIDFGQPEPELF